MKNVNDFKCGGSDSERINRAIRESDDGFVVIPRRISDAEPERDWWLLDEAILLPSDTTVILHDCRIKLSDRCRDNFFRSANCGLGVEDIKPLSNIHIVGEGRVVLEGADHPRSTGDSSKHIRRTSPHDPDVWMERVYWLTDGEKAAKKEPGFWDIHNNTYGTDWDSPTESHVGDWRNIGILFASVQNFSIENITLKDYHAWGISLEDCGFGEICRIDLDARMARVIDGVNENIENQDGVDIRNGCHDITITDITGVTGDDVVALTAIATKPGAAIHPSGGLCTTHVMHDDFSRRDRDIHNIIIRNVRAYSTLCCTIRLLPAEAHIYNIIIDGIIDTIPDAGHEHHGCLLLLGEGDGGYGNNPVDGMRGLSVSNLIGSKRTKNVICVAGYVVDSAFTNIINRNPDKPAIRVCRDTGMTNVAVQNVVEVRK